jgi:hypothetical protein
MLKKLGYMHAHKGMLRSCKKIKKNERAGDRD